MNGGFTWKQRHAIAECIRGYPTTNALGGRRVTASLARMALIMRLKKWDGRVEDWHRWRLTRVGRNMAAMFIEGDDE